MNLTVDSELGAQLLQELRMIRQRLSALESRQSTRPEVTWLSALESRQSTRPEVTWLTPAEMSKLTGVTPRTLQNYVSIGKLSGAAFKREQRGRHFHYRYHRELTLRELGMISS